HKANPRLAGVVKNTKSLKKLTIHNSQQSLKGAWDSKGLAADGIYFEHDQTMHIVGGKFARETPFTKGGYVVSDGSSGTFKHEWGHHLHLQSRKSFADEWSKVWEKRVKGVQRDLFPSLISDRNQTDLFKTISKEISEYASVNEVEFLAESFASFTSPQYGIVGDRLPVDVEAFMFKHFGGEK
ncbi:unnamed protein product, partial [marine sediment metagenome]